MNLNGKLLSLLPNLAGSLKQLAAEPRPKLGNKPPQGTRIGYSVIAGILEPEYTLPIRQQIARLAADASVRAIVLYINSPGGFVEGTPELAEVVRRAAAVKPVHVVAEGYLCSAAYYVACQASTISASPSTLVGSVGTIIVLVDDSEMFAKLGVKVLPITSGIHKFAGLPGVPVLDEHVKMLQALVDWEQVSFEAAIERGRKLSPQQMAAVTDGSVWSAYVAKNMGLIDTVELPEDRFASLEGGMPAERFTDLRGQAAAEKFSELATAAAKVDYLDDVPDSVLARLREEFPRLAAAADEHEKTNRRFSRSY